MKFSLLLMFTVIICLLVTFFVDCAGNLPIAVHESSAQSNDITITVLSLLENLNKDKLR